MPPTLTASLTASLTFPAGSPVDWFVALKHSGNTSYLYADADNPNLATSSHTLDDKGAGALANTVVPALGANYALYNDEVPNDGSVSFAVSRFTILWAGWICMCTGCPSHCVFSIAGIWVRMATLSPHPCLQRCPRTTSAGPNSSKYGHTKGVVGVSADASTGFWLVHSVPQAFGVTGGVYEGYVPEPLFWIGLAMFPTGATPLTVQDCSTLADCARLAHCAVLPTPRYPSTGVMYGQSMLCVSLGVSALNSLAEAMKLTRPQFFAKSLSATVQAKLPDLYDVVTQETCVAGACTGIGTFRCVCGVGGGVTHANVARDRMDFT